MTRIRKYEYTTYRKTIWPVALLGIIFFTTGICGTIWGVIIPLYQAFESRNWEAANGEITQSGYRLSEESFLGITVPMYRFDIRYQYRWDGIDYPGVAYTDIVTETEDQAIRFTNDNPVGRALVAYVDPEEPARSVLILQGFSWSVVLTICIFLLCTGGGLALMVMGFLNHERR